MICSISECLGDWKQAKRMFFVLFLISLFFPAISPQEYTIKYWTWLKGGQTLSEGPTFGTAFVPDPANTPGGREGAMSWESNQNLYLFGGFGTTFDNDEGRLQDLWRYSIVDNVWTWLSHTDNSRLKDQRGIYGVNNVGNTANIPGGRWMGIEWSDHTDLYLFGGEGFDEDGNLGSLRDLWKFDSVMMEWVAQNFGSTSGPLSKKADQPGIYETPPTANSIPGSRYGSVSGVDHEGNFILFGGFGLDSSGNNGYLNDLWKFDKNTNTWSFLSGSTTRNVHGSYGVRGIAYDPSVRFPGSRDLHTSWSVVEDNSFYIYGGYGYTADDLGILADLWRYDTVDHTWTWVHGYNTISRDPQYGTLNVPDILNTPGSRRKVGSGFVEGKLLLFGGRQTHLLSDLFTFDLDVSMWTWIDGPTNSLRGIYNIQGSPLNHTQPGGRRSTTTWVSDGVFYIFGGHGRGSLFGLGKLNDLWKYDITYRCNGELMTSDQTCSGHGSCLHPEHCRCQEKYKGEWCQYPLCDNVWSNDDNVCSGNGECVEPEKCSCFDGYDGDYCSLQYCFGVLSNDTSAACSGFGNCTSPNQCVCDADYFGDECDIIRCFNFFSNQSDLVCSGNGECIEPNRCQCTDGFADTTCDKIICFGSLNNETSVCSGHGDCLSPNSCSCQAGFSGENCELYQCFGIWNNETEVCSGNGECVATNDCSCDPKYSGDRCELIECFDILSNQGDVCSSQGTCVGPDTCACDENCHSLPCYAGNVCEYPYCFGVLSNETLVCSGHGLCTSPHQCNCEPGYTGDRCQFPICNNIPSNETLVCSTHGDCINPNECSCQEMYGGVNCEFSYCFGVLSNETSVCSNHGVCESPDACNCILAYHGEMCQYVECFGIISNEPEVCSNHGECESPNSCTCENGYFATDCRYPNCFGILSNSSDVCSSHGECISPNNCTCETNYSQEECDEWNCFGLSRDDPLVCSEHGVCQSFDQCACTTDYSGENCQHFNCFGVSNQDPFACSGHGECVSLNNCDCLLNYTGQSCSEWNCFGTARSDPIVCNSVGNCTEHDVCQCSDGYEGSECTEFSCFDTNHQSSSVCNGQGNCVSPNNCVCTNADYYGPECRDYDCFGVNYNSESACTGHGQCVNPSNCSCEVNYFGNSCGLHSCYGILVSNQSVCNGHGTCQSHDECVCESNYYFPPDCQDLGPSCFGVFAWEEPELVCNGHGDCIPHDNCSCNEGYFSETCNDWTCFGIQKDESNVCSGTGSCNSLDNCTCPIGYSGNSCDTYFCFEILSSNDTVCSGHGSCVEPNVCDCQESFSGTSCELYECSGVSFSDPSVCSSRGVCLSPDHCDCNQGYIGGNCELWDIQVVPQTGFALLTSFSLNFPSNVNRNTVNLTYSFKSLSEENLKAVTDPNDPYRFMMASTGDMNDDFRIQILISVRGADSQELELPFRVYPLRYYCDFNSEAPLCSPLLSNFTSYNFDVRKRSNEELLRILYTATDFAYDCNAQLVGNCPVENSLFYSNVLCRHPDRSTGICEGSSCRCHLAFTGLDCSVPTADILGRQQFQLSVFEKMDQIVADTIQSEQSTNLDLQITKCLVSDLHEIDPTLIIAALDHVMFLFETGRSLYPQHFIANGEMMLEVASRLLDFTFQRTLLLNAQRLNVNNDIYSLTHGLSKLYLNGLVPSRIISSSRIVMSLYSNHQSEILGRTIGNRFLVTLPVGMTSMDFIRVGMIEFDYNIYQYHVVSNITSGLLSLKFFDFQNAPLKVENLQERIVIRFPGLYLPPSHDDPNEIPEDILEDYTFNTDSACKYWSSGSWSSRGCQLGNLSTIVAECLVDHATDFALDEISFFPPRPVPFDWLFWGIIVGSSLALCCLSWCLCCFLCFLCCCRKRIAKFMQKFLPKKKKKEKPAHSDSDYSLDHEKMRILKSDHTIGYYDRDLGDDEDILRLARELDALKRRRRGKFDEPYGDSQLILLREEIRRLREENQNKRNVKELKNHITSLLGGDPSMYGKQYRRRRKRREIPNMDNLEDLRRDVDDNHIAAKRLQTLLKSHRDHEGLSEMIGRLRSNKDNLQDELSQMKSKSKDVVVSGEIEKTEAKLIRDANKEDKQLTPKIKHYIEEEKTYQNQKEEMIKFEEGMSQLDKRVEKLDELKGEVERNNLIGLSSFDNDAIMNLKFRNTLLEKKIRDMSKKLKLNDPNSEKIKGTLKNLRSQYQTNCEKIRTLQETLRTEHYKKQEKDKKKIIQYGRELKRLHEDNAKLSKEGNYLLDNYLELKKSELRVIDWNYHVVDGRGSEDFNDANSDSVLVNRAKRADLYKKKDIIPRKSTKNYPHYNFIEGGITNSFATPESKNSNFSKETKGSPNPKPTDVSEDGTMENVSIQPAYHSINNSHQKSNPKSWNKNLEHVRPTNVPSWETKKKPTSREKRTPSMFSTRYQHSERVPPDVTSISSRQSEEKRKKRQFIQMPTLVHQSPKDYDELQSEASSFSSQSIFNQPIRTRPSLSSISTQSVSDSASINPISDLKSQCISLQKEIRSLKNEHTENKQRILELKNLRNHKAAENLILRNQQLVNKMSQLSTLYKTKRKLFNQTGQNSMITL